MEGWLSKGQFTIFLLVVIVPLLILVILWILKGD